MKAESNHGDIPCMFPIHIFFSSKPLMDDVSTGE